MLQDLIGEKHSTFLRTRQGKKFSGFTPEQNTCRGVRSGIRRKTAAITRRYNDFSPEDRNGVLRDRRAAKYLIMVLGAVFTDERSLTNTIRDAKLLGKALFVASAIWFNATKDRKAIGSDPNIDDIYEANYAEGMRQISLLDGAPSEVNDFETALLCFETILVARANAWYRAQWTPEDEDRAARTGVWPCYFDNADAPTPMEFRKPKNTNHVYDNIDSLIYSVKSIIKATIKEKAYKYGWKTCKRVMAMCLQSLEKKTLEGLMNAQRYLKNFMTGKTTFGKRRAVGKSPKVIMSDNEVNLLHGAVRAKHDFLGMPFDLAIFRIKTS